MQNERTFVMIKPDAVQRGLIGEIISRFEKKGLKLVAMKLVSVSRVLAEKHYEIALRIMPEHLDILYSYAHLLVYGKSEYKKAEEILKKYIQLGPIKLKPDPKAYFLLGRVYYLMKDFENAYKTYNKILDFKKNLTKEEKEKLDEFIMESARNLQSE